MELTASEPFATDNVPSTSQDAEFLPAPETEAAAEVSEQTVTEGAGCTDEIPPIDALSEDPSHVAEPSFDQAHRAPSEQEAERPETSWAPSYTVTTLSGFGSSPRADLEPKMEETAEVEVSRVEKIEAVEAPKIVTPQEEPVESTAITQSPSWAHSYSVTSQPGSPRLSPQRELEEVELASQLVESVQEPPVAASVAKFTEVPETVVTPAVEDEDTNEPIPEEESKPAWTQSYSVTSQPGSPRVSPKQVSEEIPEVEEMPSWTQSYSVTSQPGSPRITPREDLEEPIVEPVAVADGPTMVVAPLNEAETPEQPKSTWTPSYSVTTMDSQIEQAPLEDTEPEQEVVPISKTSETSESESDVDAPVADTSSEPLAIKDEQPERPKSPWTPSYSVTTIPGTSSTEDPVSHSIAEGPSADVKQPAPEPAKTTETVEEQPAENGMMSDVFEVHGAVSQATVPDEPQIDIENHEPAGHGPDLVSLARFCQIMFRSEVSSAQARCYHYERG